MFFKKNYLVLIVSVVLFIIPPPVFSSPSCEDGAFSGIERSGMESYRELLVRLTKFSLGIKHLSAQQIKALETYHHMVQRERGEDGTLAKAGNYTFSQRRRIVKFLREVFTPEQVTTLIEDGVVEISRVEPANNQTRVSNYFFTKNKEAFVLVEEITPNSDKIHQGKIRLLEDLDYGVLFELEKVNFKSGQTVKEQWFYRMENETRFDSFNRVAQILKRASNGLVVKAHNGDIGFFSFVQAIENGLLPEKPVIKDYLQLIDTLHHYMSGRLNQIPVLAEAFHKGVLDTKHSAYVEFVRSLDNSIARDSYYLDSVIVTLNPEMEMMFSAIKSKREIISISDLNLPPATNMESQLRSQGYDKKSHISVIDLVNEWAVVRRRLQQLKANPYITHIEYFANQVFKHIAHIRQGFEQNHYYVVEYYKSQSDQLKKLDVLEAEARKAISEKKVTYKWWLEFNIKLSMIMSGTYNNTGLIRSSQELVNETVFYFPLKVTIPTIEPNIGIVAFNRASMEGVYPVGLVNRQIVAADGETLLSYRFMEHDFLHSLIAGNQVQREHSAGHRLFHRRLLDNIENLPLEKRKKAEAVYFLMTHENEDNNISYSYVTVPDMRGRIARMIKKDAAGLFKFSDVSVQRKEKIRDLTDTFMEVYNQTLRHQ